MKAYVLEKINQLVYKDVDMPECLPDWAIVKVKAAGICSSDIPRIFQKGTYHFPTIPGHEFAGIVEAVNNVEKKEMVGLHVGVFPLIPCRNCSQCKQRHYETCQNYDYIGSRRDGGFAEYVAVPIWNLIVLNNEISFEEAAMLEPLSVALHATKRAQIQQGEKVGIIGTGMIGFAASQWARIKGAGSVTVFGRSPQKRTIAERLGIKYCLIDNISSDYDVVIEAVGTNSSIESAIKALKPAGRLVFMGNPEKDIILHQDIYWKILRKQLTITGTWNSSYEQGMESDWSETLFALNNHKIDSKLLLSHLFAQDDIPEALNMMVTHKEPYCKIMTIWNN